MHDPLRFASSLGSKLATRSRHVCALLGAGVGRACGLPDVKELQQHVLDGLEDQNRQTLERQLANHNLEDALSRIRRISAVASAQDSVDGLTGPQAKNLDRAICRLIVKSLGVNAENQDAVICLAAWAARANYHYPIELFTVNYDLLLENALEQMRVPYFDGFVGNLQGSFHTELVEASPGSDSEAMPSFFVRLWKLHGSVNWAWNAKSQIVRHGHAVPEDEAAAIYPSDTKYEESRRVPFLVLQDRFRRALHQPETLMLISGYSFGDDHLNELIFDAAARRQRSEFLAFLYDDIPDALAQRAKITPNIQVISGHEAILGGIRAEWNEPKDASLNIWADGKFALPDFECLARHLAQSTAQLTGNDSDLNELLKKAIAGGKTQANGAVDG